jgi:hypothetical protein
MTMTADVEPRRVPEQIRLRPVPKVDLGRDVEPNRLGEPVAPLG